MKKGGGGFGKVSDGSSDLAYSFILLSTYVYLDALLSRPPSFVLANRSNQVNYTLLQINYKQDQINSGFPQIESNDTRALESTVGGFGFETFSRYCKSSKEINQEIHIKKSPRRGIK